MDQLTFTKNLALATQRMRENLARYCLNLVPNESRYLILTNAHPDAKYPQIDKGAPYTAADAVERLWRNGAVPCWIDITPLEILGPCCHFELLCYWRFTTDDELLYHVWEGFPPFHCFGPLFPSANYELERDGKFDMRCYRDRRKQQGA